jgi:ATP-dependent DNA ligase
VLFDLLALDAHDLRQIPLTERKARFVPLRRGHDTRGSRSRWGSVRGWLERAGEAPGRQPNWV